jgi:hypothetical protein
MSYYTCYNKHVCDHITRYYSSSYPGHKIGFAIIVTGFFAYCFCPQSPHVTTCNFRSLLDHQSLWLLEPLVLLRLPACCLAC